MGDSGGMRRGASAPALSRIAGRSPAAPVAFGRQGERSFRDLCARVADLADAIERAGRGPWILYSVNGYGALVGLLALARAGSCARLAPNDRPETLRELAPGAAGALVDPGSDAALPPELPRLAPLEPARESAHALAREAALAVLDPEAPFAELHTSGTSRDARRVPKQLGHLEREIIALEGRFGARIPTGARVFATVSHQHIYGLLFRVLWPFAAGRPFQETNPLHPEELLPQLAGGPSVLVTTPVHLRRLADGEALRALRGRCTVFSSGGPLPAEVAKAVAASLGASPHEVLGSTETGGVAVRERMLHGESWLPLPGVRVERGPGGRLRVTSPFVSVGEVRGPLRSFSMGDRAELAADGSFLLGGRVDRTVKIGEKRLALPEMEQRLDAHPWVAESALLARRRGGARRVHAVVVPSEPGRAALTAGGRRAVARALSRHLAQRFEPVLLPRAWRYVAALPRDAQGKLARADLEALSARPARAPGPGAPAAAGAEPVLDPDVLAEERSPGALRRRLRVPPGLAQLEGHFDGAPVVAGAVQLRWILAAAAALLGRAPRVRGFEALKFPNLLLPGQAFELRVELSAAGERLRFETREGGRSFASGRAVLAAVEDPPAGDGA